MGAPKEELRVEPKAVEAEEAEEPIDTKLDEVFFGATEDAEAPLPVVGPEAEEAPAAEPEPEPVAMPEPSEAEERPSTAVEPEKEVPDAEASEAAVVTEPATAEAFFECPECGGRVEASARSCPNCGVIFADEGADMFQCPACNTLVNVDAKSCSGCGAMFVESEEEVTQARQEPVAAAPPSPVPEPHVELEVPVSEVVIEQEEIEVEEATQKKSRFGGLFGKKKKKRQQEAEDEDAPEHRMEFPSILRGRSRKDSEGMTEAESAEEAAEVNGEEVEPEPSFAAEPEEEGPEPMPETVAPAPSEPVPEPSPKPSPPARDRSKGKELARLTAEIQPLMRLALEKGVDISESRKLVDEGAMSVRARDMDPALESVKRAKETLLKSLQGSVEQLLSDLRAEVRVATALGGEASRASAYLDELEKAGKTGDYEAMYVYAGKVKNELLPITGRYNESKQKISSLRNLVSDSEIINVNTKDARTMLAEAAKAFESNDFDKVDLTVKSATDRLYGDIAPRLDDEIKRSRNQLVELKERGHNITTMITVLKSARSLMKSKDYAQALKEMREFKDQVRKAQ